MNYKKSLDSLLPLLMHFCKMKNFFILTTVLYLGMSLFSCKNTSTEKYNPSATTSNADTMPQPEAFYPYLGYLKDQLAYIDSLPIIIHLYYSENGQPSKAKTIQSNEIPPLLKDFLQSNPSSKELSPLYEETSFKDLTINSLTFSITAKDKSLPIQQVDVLLNPNNQKIKKVFIKNYHQNNDTSFVRQLLWTNNMNCQIIETKTLPTGKRIESVTKIVWDEPLD